MQLNEGWLVGARRVPSPHHDCRPDEEAPSLLVVHNISLPPGEFGGPWIDALFTGTLDPHAHPFFAEIAHLRVSAHCLIRRDGEIVQYVPFDKRAWHAGVSSYQGVNAAMTFPSALSWKARIPWRIPMRSTSSWRR
jgi:AmpD protein